LRKKQTVLQKNQKFLFQDIWQGILELLFWTIFLFGVSSRGWTQTLDIGMVRLVFYHCAKAAGQAFSKLLKFTLRRCLIMRIIIEL
jgi:hypothetical protein